MAITTDQVRQLRELTGAGVLEAKKTLEATNGDIEAARQILHEKGIDKAAKKATREAREGRVVSYVHGDPGRIGVLLEINSETDFVARTSAFQELAHNLTLQVAASKPQWVGEGDIPAAELAARRAEYDAEATAANKPPEVVGRIVQGKLDKWLDEVVLMRQPYIRDDQLTVEQLVVRAIAEIGENIVVRRFARFELGERE
jgi:elongation factor Ts